MSKTEQSIPSKNKTTPKPLTGYHFLAMILAFFGVIISVNFTMAWLASNSWTGLVVKNSYVASQQFNKKLEAARTQKARGWQMKFEYQSANVTVTISDKNNDAVLLPKLEMTIGRPVSQSVDQTFLLTRAENGQYTKSLHLAPGIWGFELNGTGEKPYHIEGRFLVSQEGVGRMQ